MFRRRRRNYFECFLTGIGLILLTDALLTKEPKHLKENEPIEYNKQVKQINQNNMKSKLKILAIFIVMFLASFVPESNHELFGDWKCQGARLEKSIDYNEHFSCKYGTVEHGATWHWGIRHWIWLMAGLTFSVWTVIEVVDQASKKK